MGGELVSLVPPSPPRLRRDADHPLEYRCVWGKPSEERGRRVCVVVSARRLSDRGGRKMDSEPCASFATPSKLIDPHAGQSPPLVFQN